MSSGGVVETAAGPRPGTPRPKEPETIVLTPPPAETRGGRKTRHRHRKHRGGGDLTVVQDGSVWRIRESQGAYSADSEKTFKSEADAMQVVKTLQKILRETPVQAERYEIAIAADNLIKMKKNGGKRRKSTRRH